MKLKSLCLCNFRCYDLLELEFTASGVCILVGNNGAGKTNIIESISILSLAKSCLGTHEENLIKWEQEFYRITAAIEDSSGQQKQLEVMSQQAPKKQKACFINDVRLPVDRLVGVLPTVVFLPQHLDLFSGPPAQRRKFLDRLLCQVSPEYLQSLARYQKALKQRNSLLKNIAKGKGRVEQLQAWDTFLVEQGAAVTLARLELMGTLQLTLPEEMTALGETWQGVELHYERKTTATEVGELKQEYMELLKKNRERDCFLQSTTIGPHREDWQLMVAGRPVPNFASRGQQRTALIALLLLQVSYLQLRCGQKPVILLDDVFSELDDNHQQSLLKSLTDYQVILTTTHLPEGVEKAQIVEVNNGQALAPVESAIQS